MDSERSLDGRIEQLKQLAKARTETEFVERAPSWLSLSAGESTDPATTLSEAIGSIPDPVFRGAALALFPLPYTTSAGSLTERRGRAAQHFNVGANTFRTATQTRPSYEERVLDAIVQATSRFSPGPDPPSDDRHRRRVGLMLVGFVATALAAGTLWHVSNRNAAVDSPSAARPELPAASVPSAGPGRAMHFTPDPAFAGDITEPAAVICPGRNVAGTPDRQARVEAQLRRLDLSPSVCQDIRAKERWDMTVVKYLAIDGGTNWVDIEFGDGSYLVVPELAWSAYKSLRSFHADDNRTGSPTGWDISASGRSQLRTESDEVVVSARPWLPHYLVTEPFLEAWTDQHDRLGDPTANATISEVDLERGRLTLGDRGVTATGIDRKAARAELPSDEALRNSVISQTSDESWFLDAQLRRWWIPDPATFDCLTRDAPPMRDAVDGSSVALFELAGIATCAFAQLQ